MTPLGNFGGYFAQQWREADRYSGRSNYAFAPVNRLGVHNFKVGYTPRRAARPER